MCVQALEQIVRLGQMLDGDEAVRSTFESTFYMIFPQHLVVMTQRQGLRFSITGISNFTG